MSGRLTDQQRLAVDLRGADVALGAGAGCGKTTVLASRFLALVAGDDPIGLDRIAAVTFTEKAAREMRQRVRREARDRLRSADEAGRGAWRSILRRLESASILTFHGFCGEILRKFPIEAGVEPEFAILDESIAPSFRDRALAGFLRDRLAAGDPDLIALAVDYGLDPLRQALDSALNSRDRGEFSRWAATDPEEVVDGWVEAWRTEVLPASIAGLVAEARPLLDLLDSHEPTHPKMRERRASILADLPSLGRSRDPIASLRAILDSAKVQGGGLEKAWSSREVYDRVRSGFEELRGSIKEILDLAGFDRAASIEAARLGRRFAGLAAGAIGAYGAAKAEAGVLDFDDLVRKALEVVRDGPSPVLEAVRAGSEAFLVDEFQDTDPVQGELLRTIAGDRPGGGLFLVGDFKQSIYGFRGARPEVFEEFRGRFRPSGRLALNRNFRSVPGVLDFVNALFADLFPGEENALEPGREGPPGAEPAVEFVWAIEASTDAKQDVSARRKVEARWLARLVAGRLERGWMIRPKGGHAPRPAEARDVVFLFRSMTDAAAYEQALAAEGLDYHVVGGSAFYGQQEVIDLVNVLSAIDDPLDELALAGALRGPFFRVSDDALFWLASAPGGLPVGLETWRDVGYFHPRDEARLARARELLARWREAKDRGPIAGLIDLALSESGAEPALLGEFLGRRKWANVRKLVRLARRYDLQGGYSLADFVARLRADLRKPPKEEQAATAEEGGDAVRLMSIHQAKGLEFPIVVVPDLDRKSDDRRGLFATHPGLGLVLRPPSDDDATGPEAKPLGWSLHRWIGEREAKGEAHRLLYVAATRAMDRLVLSASTGPAEKPQSPALGLIAARFDRTTGRLIGEIPAGRPIPVVSVVSGPPAGPSIRKESRRGPDLLGIAGEIRAASDRPAGSTPAPVRPAWPRFVDLDPASGLPPVSARLDRLVRSALRDPSALDPRGIESAVGRAGRAQEPAAGRTLIGRAIDRLAPWVSGPIGRSIARSAEVRRGIPWSIPLDPEDVDSTVFRGVVDFACRDAAGAWRLINVADSRSPDPADRLRISLPMRDPGALGLPSVVEAWRVRLGPGGGPIRERPASADGLAEIAESYFAG